MGGGSGAFSLFMKMKDIESKYGGSTPEGFNELRRHLGIPEAPIESKNNSNINLGSSGGQTNDEETSTLNKSSTYNRNSKRGTRLVRSS